MTSSVGHFFDEPADDEFEALVGADVCVHLLARVRHSCSGPRSHSRLCSQDCFPPYGLSIRFASGANTSLPLHDTECTLACVRAMRATTTPTWTPSMRKPWLLRHAAFERVQQAIRDWCGSVVRLCDARPRGDQ